MTRFDWPLLMEAGVRGAGLRPAEFWALTPADLMLILGPGAAASPMARDALAALEATYPDEGKPDGRD